MEQSSIKVRQRVLNATANAHLNAVASQDQELTLNEINEEIRASRSARKG